MGFYGHIFIKKDKAERAGFTLTFRVVGPAELYAAERAGKLREGVDYHWANEDNRKQLSKDPQYAMFAVAGN